MARAWSGAAVVGLAAALAARTAGATTAADVCPPAADPCIVTQNVPVTPGSTLDFRPRALVLQPGGVLDVGPGSMTILAASVRLAPGTALLARGGTVGGTILVETTAAVQIEAAGTTRARLDASGDLTGGQVTVTAGGNVDGAGVLDAQGNATTGNGGTIEVTGNAVTLAGQLTTAGGGQGTGGTIALTSAGQMVLSAPLDASGGNLGGGGAIALVSGAGITTTGKLDVSARNGSADGGTLTIDAAGSVLLMGQIAGQGLCADVDGCVSSGADLIIDAGQEVRIEAAIMLSAGGPDGLGGGAAIDAGTDVLFGPAALLDVDGKGPEGLGGDVTIGAGRDVTLAALAADGGSDGGGDVLVDAGGTVRATAEMAADSRVGGFGGDIVLSGEQVVVTARVHASGPESGGVGGSVTLDGCVVEVPAGAQLAARGTGGTNLALASGQMTIGGAFSAGVGAGGAGGRNELRFRDLTLPPIIAGTATFAPARIQLHDPSLPPCGGTEPAVCGNGTLETGEGCDDGNLVGCDGCSATCRVERCGDGMPECTEECDDGNLVGCDGCAATCRLETCGNGTVECGEECDEGDANGSPGGVCAVDCTLAPPPGCGDGMPGPGEGCDDGNQASCDGCSRFCQLERCGNGQVECSEQCDDLNATSCDGCSATCRLETCGNGLRECSEECDAGALNGTPGGTCDTLCRRGVICGTGGLPGPCIPCADDADCDPLGRCAGRACDEGGVCVTVAPPECGDGDPRTIDRCVLDLGGQPSCEHGCATAAACDDGNACNGSEGCTAGVCVPGTPLVCDDRDLCTADVCDPADGCAGVRKRGLPGVGCQLDTIAALVDEAGGGIDARVAGRIRTRLDRLRGRVAAVEAAEVAGARARERSLLGRTRRQMNALRTLVVDAQRRRRLGGTLANAIASAINGATLELKALRASLTPQRS